VAFRGANGIELAVLRRIRYGIMWIDYVLEDGRLIAENEMVMSIGPTWRDPDSVSEEECQACVARIQAVYVAGNDLTEDSEAFSDLVQLQAYVAMKLARKRTQDVFALTPSVGRPN
jgi:hypothetical protein